jgi:hypothetical protein
MRVRECTDKEIRILYKDPQPNKAMQETRGTAASYFAGMTSARP